MSRIIRLTRGAVTQVDDEDYERLRHYLWWAFTANNGGFYAGRTVKLNGVTHRIYMHRFILGALPGQLVDHIDRDPLNNCRANLRLATKQQNTCNQMRFGQASGRKGVEKRGERYRAVICAEGVRHHLGTFSNPDEAARAYDAAAVRLHGAFAALNFPNETHRRAEG